MLRVRKALVHEASGNHQIPVELQPTAAAEIAVRRNHGTVAITLGGVILDSSVAELRAFLRDVAAFGATTWHLQLEPLRVVSARGLRVLVQLARVLRRRGHALTIINLPQHIYATLQALHLLHEFDWRD